MDPLARHLLSHAFNNAWANHRLLGACAQLSQAEFEAPRTGFFPSIKATLNHNLTVDWFYLDALERSLAGQPVNPAARSFFDPEQPCATGAELQAAQTLCDRRLIALCEALDAAALQREITVSRRAGPVQEPLPRLLAHLFQHQVHHRGQAHGMLSGTAVAPPQLDDFFCANDALLRVDDFRALGFNEAAIWPAQCVEPHRTFAGRDPLLLDLPTRIATERLLMRPPQAGDGPQFFEALSESLVEMRRFLSVLPWIAAEPSPEASELYCRKGQANFVARKDLPFFLFERATGQLVGATGLHRTVWETPKTEVGYWVRSSRAGRGLITEAVEATTRYAFTHIGAVRVELVTDEANEASRKVADRCGFVLDGTLRNDHRAPDGSLRNTCLYARFPPAP